MRGHLHLQGSLLPVTCHTYTRGKLHVKLSSGSGGAVSWRNAAEYYHWG
ncbi:hypothetical protein OESDEN_20674, partial [Oesophagostomum dentatum]